MSANSLSKEYYLKWFSNLTCKINYLVLRYRRFCKKLAAGLYLSPNKNKFKGKKVRSKFRAF